MDWLAVFTGGLVVVGFMQLIVFGLQATRLKQTIDKMDEIAKEQKADTNALLTATKNNVAATESLATSGMQNIELTRELERAYVSGGGSKEIKHWIATANSGLPVHASISAMPDGRTLVTEATGRFEVHINNHGKTPARLHWVRFGFCEASAPPPNPSYGIRKPARDTFGPGTQSRPFFYEPIPQQQYNRPAIFGRFYWTDIWRRGWSVGFIHEIPGPLALPSGGLYIEAPTTYSDERREPDDPSKMALE